MRRAAIQGLLSRKLRTTLTALAIVFGVAMVSGTFVLTDTISAAFNSLFATSYKNASAVISGREIVKNSTSGNATIPDTLLTKVRHVQGSAAPPARSSTSTETPTRQSSSARTVRRSPPPAAPRTSAGESTPRSLA